jgi:hypothetical protein
MCGQFWIRGYSVIEVEFSDHYVKKKKQNNQNKTAATATATTKDPATLRQEPPTHNYTTDTVNLATSEIFHDIQDRTVHARPLIL